MYASVCAGYSPFSSLFCHHHSDQTSRPDRLKIESALNTEQYATCRDDDDSVIASVCACGAHFFFSSHPFDNMLVSVRCHPTASSTIFETLVCITAPKPRTPLVRKPSFWFLNCVKCIKQHQR